MDAEDLTPTHPDTTTGPDIPERLATLALLGPEMGARDFAFHVMLEDRRLSFGMIDAHAPTWDPHEPRWRDSVLVRVVALSCNYRDRSFLALMADQLNRNRSVPFVHFGSDFVGEVVRTGDAVIDLAVGQSVVPTMEYSSGVLTNEASCGWITAPASRFVPVPEGLDEAQAAGLSLGAQTAAAMVRRSGVCADDDVLIMSSTSATSRFLAAMCRAAGIPERRIHLSSASARVSDGTGSTQPVMVADGSPVPHQAFDVVLDPFSDLNIVTALNALRAHGRYATCGFAGQYFAPDLAPALPWQLVAEFLIQKNITLIGNCLGERNDLLLALSKVPTDQIPAFPVLPTDQAQAFVVQCLSTHPHPKAVLRYRP